MEYFDPSREGDQEDHIDLLGSFDLKPDFSRFFKRADDDVDQALDRKLFRRISKLLRRERSLGSIKQHLKSIINFIWNSENTISENFSKKQLRKIPLLWIAVLGHCYDSAVLLVRTGADIDQPFGLQEPQMIDETSTILHLLAQMQASPGNDKLIRVLVNRGANLRARDSQGQTVLHIAAKEGRVEMTKLLLENGADANAANNNGATPLFEAVGSSRADDLLPMLVNHGADVLDRDDQGRNLLHQLSSGAHEVRLDLARDLIEKGVSLDDKDDQWNRPIHQAVISENNELLKLYLDHGADVNVATKKGESPLYLAAESGCAALLKTLLEHGADIEQRTFSEGLTPLHRACECAVLNSDVDENIRLLLSAGADVLAEDYSGNTAFSLIMKNFVDYMENISESTRPSIWMIIRKLALIKVSRPSTELRDERIIQRYEELADYYRDCIEQVERMKSTRFSKNCTLFDLLTKCFCQIAGFMRNPEFEINFKNCDLSTLPAYADDLRRAFERVESHYDFMLEQMDLIDEAVEYILPYLVVKKVVSYLCPSCKYEF